MELLVSILPVFIFLLCLLFLDSFKLVKISRVFISIIYGIFTAGIAYFLNSYINYLFLFDFSCYSKFIAPFIEELLKASFLFYLIKKNKIGFMIDGAILGFAIGAGFACLENLYYLNTIHTENMLLWILRGFGTAVMHGGTTAIVAIIAMALINKIEKHSLKIYFPGLIAAILIHSLYNQNLISPLISALSIFISIPIIIFIIFTWNENSLRKWLEIELYTEATLLSSLKSGKFAETKSGQYFLSIKNRFTGELIVDLMCFIRLYLELSMKAKAVMLMKEAGFPITKEPELENKMQELKSIQKRIGKTGMLAISPILRMSRKDLWKLSLLE